jgi:hypothetical protein
MRRTEVIYGCNIDHMTVDHVARRSISVPQPQLQWNRLHLIG